MIIYLYNIFAPFRTETLKSYAPYRVEYKTKRDPVETNLNI